VVTSLVLVVDMPLELET